MGRGIVLGLVLVAVVGGGALALLSSPVGAQRAADDGVAAKGASSRYRVTVLRVAVPESADGAALNLSDFAREIPGALIPRSDAPGLKGQFAAIPSQKDLVHLLAGRGTSMEVIFTGETEAVAPTKVTVGYGQRFPISSVEIKGTQRFVTTKFEQTGMKVELDRRDLPGVDGDIHTLVAELSAVTAHQGGLNPVIFEVASKGRFRLPDGYTLVLSYLDRVEGFVFMHSTESLAEGKSANTEIPADIVAQYFMLITRMDLK